MECSMSSRLQLLMLNQTPIVPLPAWCIRVDQRTGSLMYWSKVKQPRLGSSTLQESKRLSRDLCRIWAQSPNQTLNINGGSVTLQAKLWKITRSWSIRTRSEWELLCSIETHSTRSMSRSQMVFPGVTPLRSWEQSQTSRMNSRLSRTLSIREPLRLSSRSQCTASVHLTPSISTCSAMSTLRTAAPRFPWRRRPTRSSLSLCYPIRDRWTIRLPAMLRSSNPARSQWPSTKQSQLVSLIWRLTNSTQIWTRQSWTTLLSPCRWSTSLWAWGPSSPWARGLSPSKKFFRASKKRQHLFPTITFSPQLALSSSISLSRLSH